MKKSVLLIISGGVAAYKALTVIRDLTKIGIKSKVILTKGGSEFVTPLSVGALSGNKVYTDLWNLTDETEMGHIELSRSADLIAVVPATANLIAKAANGVADDLASTTILATDKPVLYAPSMNVRMWEAEATKRNIKTLENDGALFVGPGIGEMACGETGPGRMSEPHQIVDAIVSLLKITEQKTDKKPIMSLTGKSILITAGPTQEPIDPVRYLSNESSGKQGYALAEAASKLGAKVTLVSGPVNVDAPPLVKLVKVTTAKEMLEACQSSLPADIFISVAAVSDWRPKSCSDKKLKKDGNAPAPLELENNIDILKTISSSKNRPKFVIGFAAETNNIIENATKKKSRKNCDWIIANDVSGNVMGGNNNKMIVITENKIETWPELTKQESAERLARKIAQKVI